MAKTRVGLAPGRVAFYDELTGIHLGLQSPVAEVPGDSDLKAIKSGLRAGTLIMIEGNIEDLEQKVEEKDEDSKAGTEKEDETEDAPTDESKEAEKDTSEGFTEKELEDLTVPDLKDLAREKDLSGYSSMKKDSLIALILDS